MAEWLKAHAWKACLLERVTWVRIPLSPPDPAKFICRDSKENHPIDFAKSAIVAHMMDLSSCENYLFALRESSAIPRRWIFRFRLPRSNVQPATHGELRPQNETGYPPRARLCAASGAGPRFAC